MLISISFILYKISDFFEDLAQESKISSEQPLIIRHGMMARKTLARRAKTVRYNESRKRSTSKYEKWQCDILVTRTKLRIFFYKHMHRSFFFILFDIFNLISRKLEGRKILRPMNFNMFS